MKFKKTYIEGLFLVEIDRFEDERGYLAKFFDKKNYVKNNVEFNLTQVKYVFTKTKGTTRGLHMQSKPFEESKLVHCIRGRIFEVAVDLRPKSKTYGKWFGVEFSESDKYSLYLPEGFAHGYQTLTDDCYVLYMMSGQFVKKKNIGFRWNDPFFNINWPLKPTVIAKKDLRWPLLKK